MRQAGGDGVSYFAYLSPPCQRQAETIRQLLRQHDTARSVVVTPELRSSISAETERYRVLCADDERQARAAATQSMHAEANRQRAEQQRLATQLALCEEMRRLRDSKQARWDSLTPGERADHERFVTNFTERCRGVARP